FSDPACIRRARTPRQVAFAHTTEHSQVGFEQEKETLRSMLMHVTTRVFLLRMIDERVHVALHRPVAAGRVRREPTARLHRAVGCLLYCLDREIFSRLDDDS